MIYVLSGGGKLFSIIAVTYPAGSICTCTNGTKTLKAKDTSGKALFNVSEGEWTVTATDGNNTKSAAVSITQEGQCECLLLYYELVLIDNGSLNKDLTGEWKFTKYNVWDSAGTPSITNESGYLRLYASYGSWVYFTHSNAIDVTDFTTLRIKIGASQNKATTVKVGLSTSNNNNALTVSSGDISTGSSTTTLTLDVSAVSGNVYFKVVSGEQNTIRIYDLRIA